MGIGPARIVARRAGPAENVKVLGPSKLIFADANTLRTEAETLKSPPNASRWSLVVVVHSSIGVPPV